MKNKYVLYALSGIIACAMGPAAHADEAVDKDGFTECTDGGSVNIRQAPDTGAAVVGILKNHAFAYVESEDENGWYKVQSGNITGYVASQYIATDEEAEKIKKEVAYTSAYVGAETLNIRADRTQDSEVVSTAGQGEALEVVQDDGDWVKVVDAEGLYGWVSSDYVDVRTEYPLAEEIPDDNAQSLSQEINAEQTDSESAANSYNDSYDTTEDGGDANEENVTQAQTSADSESNDLYQKYLEAQDAANHPTTAEDAQQKADAAIAAYNAYLASAGTDISSTDVQQEQDTEARQQPQTEASVQSAAPETEAPTQTAPETETPAEQSGSSIGAQAAAYAQQFVGNPYVYGGSSLSGGTDCSGFTMSVYSKFGISLPHNAAAQSGCGVSVPVSTDSLQPGDLLFYDHGTGAIDHVGLYIGGGTIVHASNPSSGIKYSSAFYSTPVCARRLA